MNVHDDEFRGRHESMMRNLKEHGIRDERVLNAMAVVKRHRFIPEKYRAAVDPYGDHPCAVGFEQTISQPFMVAYMTKILDLKPGERVLEIGAGTGYQSAILAEMGVHVIGIEVIPQLADRARKTLVDEGYGSVEIKNGDGYEGAPDSAPFDAVLVACAPASMPQKLVEQLGPEGRMIVPVGSFSQRLILVRRKKGKVITQDDISVIFVPMVHGRKQ